MPAMLLSDAAPAASALRPTGPAANDTLPPRVMDPACAKVLTAAVSLRMKTKSVSSKPIWPPNPPPSVPIALGALQVPSGSRATTRPLPNRPDPRNPALKTVMMARPLALERTDGGMILSGPKACRGLMNDVRILPHFLHSAVQKKKNKSVSSFIKSYRKLLCSWRSKAAERANLNSNQNHLHAMEAGRGLLMPIVSGVACARRSPKRCWQKAIRRLKKQRLTRI